MDPICTVDTPLYGPSLPFWARPGFATFAKKDEGGKADDELDDDDEEDDDEEDDDEEDEDADKSEDELREELKRIRGALSAASGQSKKRRQRLQQQKKDHEAELERLRGGKGKKKDDEDDDDKVDAEAIREAVRREEREKADARTIKAEARGALRGAGVSSERVAKAVGLLDLGDLDVDDDGNVDGLDDAIEELKREWPELFPAKAEKKRRPGAGPAADDEERRGKRKLTASQQQARLLTGRR